MHSKKMWQTLLILFLFLFVSALLAWAAASLLKAAKWQLVFGIGAGLMVVALVPLFLRAKYPKIAAMPLCINALACGFLVAAYFIGSKTALSLPAALYSALAASGAYLVFMLLLTVPVLRDKRIYIAVVSLLWCAALFLTGGILWHTFGAGYAAFTLFCIFSALFAFASLFPSQDMEELLCAFALPSSFAAGIVAVIVLCALAGDGDCDCCDGADCGDCCDCTPDYGGGKKRTTMSELSAPSEGPKKYL